MPTEGNTVIPACGYDGCGICAPGKTEDERMAAALEAASKGMFALDTNIDDWRSKIDKNTLVLEDINKCVLAQVFGDYRTGFHEMFGLLGTDDMAQEHGFVDKIEAFNYAELTAAWLELLR